MLRCIIGKNHDGSLEIELVTNQEDDPGVDGIVIDDFQVDVSRMDFDDVDQWKLLDVISTLVDSGYAAHRIIEEAFQDIVKHALKPEVIASHYSRERLQHILDNYDSLAQKTDQEIEEEEDASPATM